ncbi:methyl-accepting chemotaxis protein [Desulfosporosinus sp. PR]|uniref:methyl-accepting chemotaxis protein n=1 Tax=Candidatus Desulfosporosinus nitrosoreducens TaxID=3401928 RepID=UPI0027F56925|nr:methyl-accepting chemotaxis protein [Desulfosporosinus sp. PR]MDQ7092937.1 methyl-accepting chemotaxis protein [Desulfosporosinus sp. PR]
MNIKKRLIIGFLLIVVLFSAVCGFALFKIADMESKAKAIDSKWLPSIEMMGWFNGAVSNVARLNLAMVSESDTAAEAKLDDQQTKLLQEINQKLQVYQKGMISGPEEQKLFDSFKKDWELYTAKILAIKEAIKSNNTVLAKEMIDNADPLWTQANTSVTDIIAFNNNAGLVDSKNSVANAKSAYLWVSIFSIGIIILALVLGWFIALMIANPMAEMVANVQEVANGNLAIKKVEIKSKDEVGSLGMALNAMTDNLRTLIEKVSELAIQVATSAGELTSTAEQSAQSTSQIAVSINEIASGAEQQVTAIDETSAIVEQMSAGIQQIAVNTATVLESATKTANASHDGGKAITTAIEQMKSIEKTVTYSAEIITKLGERSNEIGEIVATISGIAGQTNLLALNAAIEAARAGEQGRGFAVVAEEVRKLAEQSSDAANKIAELIDEVQGDTNNAVSVMGTGTTEVKVGTEVVTAAGQAFNEIAALIVQVSDQVKEISASIQQIAGRSQDMVVSMREIDKIAKDASGQTQTVSATTEEHSASVEEIAASSESLAEMARDLQSAVNIFRV